MQKHVFKVRQQERLIHDYRAEISLLKATVNHQMKELLRLKNSVKGVANMKVVNEENKFRRHLIK